MNKLKFLFVLTLFSIVTSYSQITTVSTATAITTAINNGYKTLILDSDITIAPYQTITIPEGVTLEISNDYKFIVQPASSLIIDGIIDAGFYRIFDIKKSSSIGNGSVTGKPSITFAVPQWWQDPNSTNWTEAIQYAVNFYPRVYFPQVKTRYTIDKSIILSKNMAHHLFGEDTNSHILNTSNEFSFRLEETSASFDKRITIEHLMLSAINGIGINENNTIFTEDNYILNIKISNCIFIQPFINIPNKSTGTAIVLNKVFDADISFNQITAFKIGINLIGSDICSIHDNRIEVFHQYAILDQSYKTFGSQNLITHNDLLNYSGPDNEGAYIKSFSRIVSIRDNYLENAVRTNNGVKSIVKVKAMMDISNLDVPTHATNHPKSNPLTIFIEGNRLDMPTLTENLLGQEVASYSYLIQDSFANLYLNDLIGVSDQIDGKFINANGSIVNTLKTRVNTNRNKGFDISSKHYGNWDGFKTKETYDKIANSSYIIDSRHFPTSLTETNGEGVYFNPLYARLNTGANTLKKYNLNLNSGAMSSLRNVKFIITFRVHSNGSLSTNRPYIIADSYSGSTMSNNDYEKYLTVNPYDYLKLEFNAGVNFPTKIELEVANCILDIKSIEIVPTITNH